MKKQVIVGLVLGVALVAILGGMIIDSEFNDDDGMGSVPYTPSDDVDFEDTLNYAFFEEYGPVLLIVALLLFGAIIGGACISREEDDEE